MASEELIKYIFGADFRILIPMGVMFWFFYKRLDEKMDKKFTLVDQKMDQRFDKVDQRFERLEEKVTDIDRRLCRIEGSLSSKDCCMLKNDHSKREAQ